MKTERDPVALAIEAVLWILLWAAIVTVVLMTWHPWVIGSRAGCPPGQTAGWDGRCRP